MPSTKFESLLLDNGLRALFVEDRSSPVVNVQVWYHVGSKDEPAGQTRFAHLFEHLMFEGTRNLGPDQPVCCGDSSVRMIAISGRIEF